VKRPAAASERDCGLNRSSVELIACRQLSPLSESDGHANQPSISTKKTQNPNISTAKRGAFSNHLATPVVIPCFVTVLALGSEDATPRGERSLARRCFAWRRRPLFRACADESQQTLPFRLRNDMLCAFPLLFSRDFCFSRSHAALHAVSDHRPPPRPTVSPVSLFQYPSSAPTPAVDAAMPARGQVHVDFDAGSCAVCAQRAQMKLPGRIAPARQPHNSKMRHETDGTANHKPRGGRNQYLLCFRDDDT
jgi:hypothetical protein